MKIRDFLSESLKNECTEDKRPEHCNKIASSPARLQLRFIKGKIKTFIVEASRNYTHKSFITFFTVGLIFLPVMIIEFGRLIWTTSTSTKPEVILDLYLGFVGSVCIFSITFVLLFLFWEVVQHAIYRTTWEYNCLRVLFLVTDVITAVKWYSAAVQARPDRMINYILMTTYIKAGSLALLGLLFFIWCVYRQRKNETFRSLLKLKFGVLAFFPFHIILIIAFKCQGISWQTTAIVCCSSYLGLAVCIMVLPRSSKKDSGLVMQIKITGLLIVFYVIIISLFLVVHYDMDCNNNCGQRTRSSTHVPIKQNLDTSDTSKVFDGDFTDLKEEMTSKINQNKRDDITKKDARFSYMTFYYLTRATI